MSENIKSKFTLGRVATISLISSGILLLFLNWETWITNSNFQNFQDFQVQLDFCSIYPNYNFANVWDKFSSKFKDQGDNDNEDATSTPTPPTPIAILDRSLYNSSEASVLLSPAVLLRPKGGIGNQLFQYACNYALARRNSWPLYIFIDKLGRDFLSEGESRGIPPHMRNFALDRFHIFLEPWNTVTDNWTIKGDLNYLNDSQILSGQYVRDGSVIIQQSNNDYCQSEIFFKDYANELWSMFKFKVINVGEGENEDWRHLVNVEDDGGVSVGVHVRRGDFVLLNISVPYSFYHDAIVQMTQKLSPTPTSTPRPAPITPHLRLHFFIFSDYIDAVEKEFFATNNTKFQELLDQSQINVTFIRHPDLISGVQELYLLSRCHHQIIPNSSFGWWGAYLNDNPGKIVIAAHHDSSFFDKAFTTDEQRNYHKLHYRYLYYPVSWITVDPFKT